MTNSPAPPISYTRFRPVAMALEAIPFIIVLLGFVLTSPQMQVIGFTLASLVYVIAGWYLFRRERIRGLDITLATFFGFLLSVVLIGIMYEVLDWPGAREMLLIGVLTLKYGIVLSLIFMAVRYMRAKNRAYSLTMSQKIFSRFLILLILVYAFGLDRPIGSALG